MDYLRHGITCVVIAQRPKQEYKRESFSLFQEAARVDQAPYHSRALACKDAVRTRSRKRRVCAVQAEASRMQFHCSGPRRLGDQPAEPCCGRRQQPQGQVEIGVTSRAHAVREEVQALPCKIDLQVSARLACKAPPALPLWCAARLIHRYHAANGQPVRGVFSLFRPSPVSTRSAFMAVGLGPLPTLQPVPGFQLGIASAGIKRPGRKDVVIMRLAEGAQIAA